MSTTTHAPKAIDPSSSLHAEALGLAKNHGRLTGRRIIVVGAGQRTIVDEEPPIGNGRAMSVLFAREGAAVACLDVNKDAADGTVAQITKEGGKAFTDVVDVSDVAAIAPAVERCAQKLGGLDGLALNVGISSGLSLPKMTAEAWDRDYAVNVRSHMLFAQKALELMAPGGAIILISSMASQRAGGRNPAYESSKAAQIALGRAIARAGEDKGIRCNVIAPGFMDTPMGRDASRRRSDRALTVPFGRQGTGWEVAYSALFLISNESSYVNAHTLFLDAGHMGGIVRG
ncbi:NAD(P)-dependent dehydrogenase (short-subunit alcohol dehydrogenase family) [Bradyrhizobium macuxiense]|uniref:NAD(P)-dependent dehydrogenase (Short-subunit alcohol dehydrogenase family) n=1 Tax=Bradyrhizobium macuxiense TaxID=1755647 RepID=A0A560LSI6_9BRAD|nr:SDR family oxidoreductase [Bradyrhizobium macuxiense]TWB98235.1 NAD(P)-dependent dehydrogenase (short-subunit alcohol dehydrogenase family) [Bradyrhizobium macuxiense]